jgi:hypothetical protein
MDFAKYLSFLLQFCPEVPEEKALRAKFAEIGIAPGKPFERDKLSEVQKGELVLGLKDSYDGIEKAVANLGKHINGWPHRLWVNTRPRGRTYLSRSALGMLARSVAIRDFQ